MVDDIEKDDMLMVYKKCLEIEEWLKGELHEIEDYKLRMKELDKLHQRISETQTGEPDEKRARGKVKKVGCKETGS